MSDDFLDESNFKDVEVEDYENKDLLVADLPLFSICGFSIVIPIIFFILSLGLSFFVPPMVHSIVQNENLLKNEFTNPITIKSSVESLSPKNRFLQLIIQFNDFINSSSSTSEFLPSVTITTNKGQFDQTISVSDQKSQPLTLYSTTNIDFLYAILSINFDKEPPVRSITIIWNFCNPFSITYIQRVRICFIFCIIIYFAILGKKVYLSNPFKQESIQNFTIILMSLAFLYLFPFSYVFDSSKSYYVENVFKNIFYGYVLFYSMSIYIYIIEDSVDSPINYLLFPYFIFISFTIFWLIKDNKYIYPKPDSISFENIPHFYYSLFISVFCFILVIWIYCFSRIKKDSHSCRFNYYLVANLYGIISFILYVILTNLETIFTLTIAKNVFPIATLTLYTLIMAYGQYDTDEETDKSHLFTKGLTNEYQDNGVLEA
ncbi:hypothetical protein M9Y10_005957 [Tritrichomonas musculus]|uniref:Transmembrane protein n=1 Tax=Tritrichomonas musculus TaxID=1915356 RepID=A0ABR2JF66_9EUKA